MSNRLGTYIKRFFCKHKLIVRFIELPSNAYGEKLQIKECLKCREIKMKLIQDLKNDN